MPTAPERPGEVHFPLVVVHQVVAPFEVREHVVHCNRNVKTSELLWMRSGCVGLEPCLSLSLGLPVDTSDGR